MDDPKRQLAVIKQEIGASLSAFMNGLNRKNWNLERDRGLLQDIFYARYNDKGKVDREIDYDIINIRDADSHKEALEQIENQVQGLKVEIGGGQHVTVKSVKEADGFENGPKPLGLNGLVREEKNANPAFKDSDHPIIGGKGGKKSGSANPEIKGKGNVMQ